MLGTHAPSLPLGPPLCPRAWEVPTSRPLPIPQNSASLSPGTQQSPLSRRHPGAPGPGTHRSRPFPHPQGARSAPGGTAAVRRGRTEAWRREGRSRGSVPRLAGGGTWGTRNFSHSSALSPSTTSEARAWREGLRVHSVWGGDAGGCMSWEGVTDFALERAVDSLSLAGRLWRDNWESPPTTSEVHFALSASQSGQDPRRGARGSQRTNATSQQMLPHLCLEGGGGRGAGSGGIFNSGGRCVPAICTFLLSMFPA